MWRWCTSDHVRLEQDSLRGPTTFKKAGKVMLVNTAVVSADGKMLTATAKGTDAQGRAVNNLQFYDKQ